MLGFIYYVSISCSAAASARKPTPETRPTLPASAVNSTINPVKSTTLPTKSKRLALPAQNATSKQTKQPAAAKNVKARQQSKHVPAARQPTKPLVVKVNVD